MTSGVPSNLSDIGSWLRSIEPECTARARKPLTPQQQRIADAKAYLEKAGTPVFEALIYLGPETSLVTYTVPAVVHARLHRQMRGMRRALIGSAVAAAAGWLGVAVLLWAR